MTDPTHQRRPSDRIGADEYNDMASVAAPSLYPGVDFEAMTLSFNMIRMANRLIKDLEVSVHRPKGMSFSSFRVLFAISAAERITPNELARLSSVSTASMSSMLNTLERSGLIVRESDPEDGRRFIISLTEKGRGKLADALPPNNAREREWADGLTPGEQVLLLELLRKWLRFRPANRGGAEHGSEEQ